MLFVAAAADDTDDDYDYDKALVRITSSSSNNNNKQQHSTRVECMIVVSDVNQRCFLSARHRCHLNKPVRTTWIHYSLFCCRLPMLDEHNGHSARAVH